MISGEYKLINSIKFAHTGTSYFPVFLFLTKLQLTLSCIKFKNGQTHFKDIAANVARFLTCLIILRHNALSDIFQKTEFLLKFCFKNKRSIYVNLLTHFKPMFHVYTPWNHQKTRGFLKSSGCIEIEQWLKMD